MVKSKINKQKYANALLYFLSECGNDKLGIMKLNKLFYYLDFISYRDRAISVTGETYLHLPKGPFAESLSEKMLPQIKKDKLIAHTQDKSDKYGMRNRFVALKQYDLNVFDEYEQNLLAEVVNKFKSWNTSQMVAQTHTEAPWVFSKQGDVLDYENADDIDVLRELA